MKELIEIAPGQIHTLSYLCRNKIFENKFDLLKAGFTATPKGDFETLDQWIKAPSTDKIVAAEVEYDSKMLKVKVTPPLRENEPDNDGNG
jgi:hypothetical protein